MHLLTESDKQTDICDTATQHYMHTTDRRPNITVVTENNIFIRIQIIRTHIQQQIFSCMKEISRHRLKLIPSCRLFCQRKSGWRTSYEDWWDRSVRKKVLREQLQHKKWCESVYVVVCVCVMLCLCVWCLRVACVVWCSVVWCVRRCIW